jgi:hypothetical protein
MTEDQSNLEPAESDVEAHMRPDEASMFGADHPATPKPPKRRPAPVDEDDVEGHGAGSGPVMQTGRPPRENDR